VDKFIRGKRAITSYSNQIIELDGLDRNMTLDSTFSLHDGATITFREYYAKKRDINGNEMQLLEANEEALVVHHRYSGRGEHKRIEDTIYFLPQLLFVIVPVEQHNERTKRQLRSKAHPPVQEVVTKALELNRMLAQINKTAPFRTEDRCIECRGYVLEPPLICFKTARGIQRERATTFSGRTWKNVNSFWYRLSELYDGDNGDGGDRDERGERGIEWAICYDKNDRNGMQCVERIEEYLAQWNRDRQFGQSAGGEPLRRPARVGLDYGDLTRIREKLRRNEFRVCLFILGSNPQSPKVKVDITRHILFYEQPQCALSTPCGSPSRSRSSGRRERGGGRRGDKDSEQPLSLDLQFVNAATVNKRNAVYNVFETVLLKSKVILYYLEPMLPSQRLNYHRLWMVGVKILRKKSGAHLVVLCCNRAPMMGSIQFITNHSSLIPAEKDVIPQRLMYELTRELLTASLRKIVASKGDEVLPTNIVVLRSGGGDGLLKTIISKEIAGFKQALSEFAKTDKELIRSANHGASSKWYPGVMASVLQENVPDAFGVKTGHDGQRLMDSQRALVVNEKITSSQHLDVFLSLPTKQEKQLYGRVLRIVTLMDDYNDGADATERPRLRLRKEPELFSDFVALIYSSIWSYALNIPFPKVPNYPSPIKFAEHYASWQYSILTEGDHDLKALRIDVDNAKPRICTVIPKAARMEDEPTGGQNDDFRAEKYDDRKGRDHHRDHPRQRDEGGDVAMRCNEE